MDGSTKILVVEKLHESVLRGTPGSKWKCDFKVNCILIGYKCMDWIQLARYKAYLRGVVNTRITLWQDGTY
jgi:hypothetical protein